MLLTDPIIDLALLEDLSQGDCTTDNLQPWLNRDGQYQVTARQACVVSGLSVAQKIVSAVDSSLSWQPVVDEGDPVTAQCPIALLEGPIHSILKAERTLLNFLQHLSGIATCTRQFIEAVEGTDAKIVHTRKTTPGLRALEQQAVLHGGGSPHRFHLGSAAMVKDNHLAGLGEYRKEGLAQLRQRLSHTQTLEIEVDSPEQIPMVLEAKADIILLDNFTPLQVKAAVALIAGRAIIEVSGGITLETVRAYAEAGASIISTSQITLGAPAVDIGLDEAIEPTAFA